MWVENFKVIRFEPKKKLDLTFKNFYCIALNFSNVFAAALEKLNKSINPICALLLFGPPIQHHYKINLYFIYQIYVPFSFNTYCNAMIFEAKFEIENFIK